MRPPANMSCVGPTQTHMSIRGAPALEQFRDRRQREFNSACRNCSSGICLGRSAFSCDGMQRARVGGPIRCLGCHPSVMMLDIRLRCTGEEEHLLHGSGCLWRRVGLSVLPIRDNYRFLTKFYRRDDRAGALGIWRNEFCEAPEVRTYQVFKFVNVRANFVCNPQKRGSHTGHPKYKIRGQQGDLDSVTLPSNGPSVSAPLDGVSIKVVGAGAGASAILNFCRQSSLLPSAQFWYSSDAASQPIRLSESIGGENSTTNGFGGTQDPVIGWDSHGKTVFLVVGAGSGAGLGPVPGQLKAAQSKGSLVVGIFIQPFMFEGQKRLEQATQVINTLLNCTDLLLIVEQDGLLRREVVTVSEASSVAKNAVLLSIKAISELLLGKAEISLGTGSGGSFVTSDDKKKMLQRAGKAWLGSGKGQNFEEAIEKAVAEAPMSDYRPFGARRLVLCSLASAVDQGRDEMVAAESVLYQTLGPDLQLMVSIVKNPMLENGVTLATIIICRLDSPQMISMQLLDQNGDQYSVPSMVGINTSIDSNFGPQLTVNASTSSNSRSLDESLLDMASPTVAGSSPTTVGTVGDYDSSTMNQGNSVAGTRTIRLSDEQNSYLQKPKLQPTSLEKKSSGRSYRPPSREDMKSLDVRQVPQASLASSASKRSRLALGWEAGPSSDLAEAWAQARAQARDPTQVTSALDVSLPVGVRLDSDQSASTPMVFEVAEDKWIGTAAVPVDPDALPRNRMMDIGLEAMRDMYNAASALVMGKEMTDDRRQASLAQRAASMLESERSNKKLTPLVEMEFKNGSYKGRCRAGLPEGKGRLSFSDGSFYEGQWKQGKRAGSGAFYYANGDMFQGSWKDDVMHGKGWMYYHNGDRLYANFWKGKADGDGRFYSAQGDVFFGQFRENWRHGEFLYIEASGVRWSEFWENGILKSRNPVDS